LNNSFPIDFCTPFVDFLVQLLGCSSSLTRRFPLTEQGNPHRMNIFDRMRPARRRPNDSMEVEKGTLSSYEHL
ncbi:hypothetical protein, partial [Flavonifractor plautii]|uniref:hypothetical protein n=1 Tax=Flavonifractor plautii TaxID=292800 RepID=UPI001A9B8AA2